MTKLTLRLEKILSHILPCGVLADIGTDHTKIPVAAVERGLCQFALATDKSTAAVRSATEYIKSRELTDRVRVLQGDALNPIADETVNCLVIAGMGGILISEMLNNGLRGLLEYRSRRNPFNITSAGRQLNGLGQIILLPHRDVSLARDTLLRHGLTNISDDLFTDKGKAYHILDCEVR
ncbi:MAG: class I SAM-dependent methyltransferase [Clostridiales bacterium]|jgi:tRNA (adenine22-N1)-methyltransferase|nr:class I SAM-dependent methyltransferase [Clostridiales bacterium]